MRIWIASYKSPITWVWILHFWAKYLSVLFLAGIIRLFENMTGPQAIAFFFSYWTVWHVYMHILELYPREGKEHNWLSDFIACHWLLRYFMKWSNNSKIKVIFLQIFINYFTFSWQWLPSTFLELSRWSLHWKNVVSVSHLLSLSAFLDLCFMHEIVLITSTLTRVWQLYTAELCVPSLMLLACS